MTPTADWQRHTGPNVVVVVTDHWEPRSERGWITRQVAGSLACEADVHVVMASETLNVPLVDGVFTLHGVEDGTGEGAAHRLRADCVVVATSSWSTSADLLATIERSEQFVVDDATRVVMADLTLASSAAGATTTQEALAQLSERVHAWLVVSDDRSASLLRAGVPPDRIHTIGAPLSANPTARSEPDPMVGDAPAIVVNSGVGEGEPGPSTVLTELLRMRFPERIVAVLHTDAFCVWQNGRLARSEAVGRTSDVARLMAWAQVTVDLRPGRFFARRCLESLLYGTPIVVPHTSRAREYAERGRSGLWFTNAPELAWCVEAMFDPQVRDALGTQGQAYAEAHFGSTDRFIQRVLDASGLVTASGSP